MESGQTCGSPRLFCERKEPGIACEDNKRKAREPLEAVLLEDMESGDAIPVTPNYWKELWARADTRKQAKRSIGATS